jgi:rSAM/selenodomain-associated transferase 1
MQQRFRLELHSQQGHDLGERMLKALNQGLHAHDTVILIGSDCPFFSANYLNKAFELLTSGIELIFGPAKDGGFVLLGANKPIPEKFFTGIDWGKSTVLREARQRVEQNEIRYEMLRPLQDIDRPEDLKLIEVPIYFARSRLRISSG